jgi:hypothetical protein
MPAPRNHGPGWTTGHRLYEQYVVHASQRGPETLDYEAFMTAFIDQTGARVIRPTRGLDRALIERLLEETRGPVVVRHPDGEDLIIGVTIKGEHPDGEAP